MAPDYKLVGILNVTPDSYVDGGQYVTSELAIRRADQLLTEGADIIEIGGESTGPGSPHVSTKEELQRTLPIIEVIHKEYPEAILSIDTYKATVAQAAIEAGVRIINDVTAGRGDTNMFSVTAQTGVDLVLMYAKDQTPRTTKQTRQYDDVLTIIADFLRQRIAAAQQAGVSQERIILDPGMGHFISSDPQYSFQVLARLPRLQEFLDYSYPLLVSPSRKSFLAGSEQLEVADRLPGTVAASAIAVLHGARYIRTHDVAAVRRGCEVAVEIIKYKN